MTFPTELSTILVSHQQRLKPVFNLPSIPDISRINLCHSEPKYELHLPRLSNLKLQIDCTYIKACTDRDFWTADLSVKTDHLQMYRLRYTRDFGLLTFCRLNRTLEHEGLRRTNNNPLLN